MKRGISPLIGVLLIIGFTIGIALLIFIWGQKFTIDVIEITEKEALQRIEIITGVDIIVRDLFYKNSKGSSVPTMHLKIENTKTKPIQELLVKITNKNGESTIKHIKPDKVLTYYPILIGFGINTFDTEYSNPLISKVEVIPIVDIKGEFVRASNINVKPKITEKTVIKALTSYGAKLYLPSTTEEEITLTSGKKPIIRALYDPNERQGAYKFTEADKNYIEIPDNPSLSALKKMTLSLWLKLDPSIMPSSEIPNDDSSISGIVSKAESILGYGENTDIDGLAKGENKEWILYYDAREGFSVIRFIAYDTDLKWIAAQFKIDTSNYNLEANKWYHLTLTWDASAEWEERIKFYLNGFYVTEQWKEDFYRSASFNIKDSSASIFIGGSNHQYESSFFNGYIDDVMIYDKLLKPEEILDLYNAQKI